MSQTIERPFADLPDDELVRRYRHDLDAEGALAELYERYRTMTFAFFRRRIGVPEIAAEQNQELYMTVVEHLGSFREESSFRTWLFQIAHHRLSHLRRRWAVHVDERATEVPDDLWNELVASPGESPEMQASHNQVAGALRRCLAALQEVERAVIYGQYYAGVTLQLLGEELRLTNKSGARAVLIAAQRKLKKCLRQSGVDSGAALDALGDSP